MAADPRGVGAVKTDDDETVAVENLNVSGIGLATAAKQDTGNASLVTIDGHVDGLETLATAGNASLASIDGKLPTAAAPADGVTNAENATSIRARLTGFNGTTWDRIRTGITGVITSLIGYLMTITVVRYVVTRVTLTDGQATELQSNNRGDLSTVVAELAAGEDTTVGCQFTRPLASASATGTWTPYSSGTTLVGTAGLSASAAAGNIRKYHGENNHATLDIWLLAVDKASAPVANDAALWAVRCPPKLAGAVADVPPDPDFGEGGLKCVLGVAFAFSVNPCKVDFTGIGNDNVAFAMLK